MKVLIRVKFIDKKKEQKASKHFEAGEWGWWDGVENLTKGGSIIGMDGKKQKGLFCFN